MDQQETERQIMKIVKIEQRLSQTRLALVLIVALSLMAIYWTIAR